MKKTILPMLLVASLYTQSYATNMKSNVIYSNKSIRTTPIEESTLKSNLIHFNGKISPLAKYTIMNNKGETILKGTADKKGVFFENATMKEENNIFTLKYLGNVVKANSYGSNIVTFKDNSQQIFTKSNDIFDAFGDIGKVLKTFGEGAVLVDHGWEIFQSIVSLTSGKTEPSTEEILDKLNQMANTLKEIQQTLSFWFSLENSLFKAVFTDTANARILDSRDQGLYLSSALMTLQNSYQSNLYAPFWKTSAGKYNIDNIQDPAQKQEVLNAMWSDLRNYDKSKGYADEPGSISYNSDVVYRKLSSDPFYLFSSQTQNMQQLYSAVDNIWSTGSVNRDFRKDVSKLSVSLTNSSGTQFDTCSGVLNSMKYNAYQDVMNNLNGIYVLENILINQNFSFAEKSIEDLTKLHNTISSGLTQQAIAAVRNCQYFSDKNADSWPGVDYQTVATAGYSYIVVSMPLVKVFDKPDAKELAYSDTDSSRKIYLSTIQSRFISKLINDKWDREAQKKFGEYATYSSDGSRLLATYVVKDQAPIENNELFPDIGVEKISIRNITCAGPECKVSLKGNTDNIKEGDYTLETSLGGRKNIKPGEKEYSFNFINELNINKDSPNVFQGTVWLGDKNTGTVISSIPFEIALPKFPSKVIDPYDIKTTWGKGGKSNNAYIAIDNTASQEGILFDSIKSTATGFRYKGDSREFKVYESDPTKYIHLDVPAEDPNRDTSKQSDVYKTGLHISFISQSKDYKLVQYMDVTCDGGNDHIDCSNKKAIWTDPVLLKP